MPLNDRPKWILATAAAIAATSVGGVALATSGGSDSALPDSVALQDRVPAATQTIEATATPTLFEVRSGPIVRAEDGSFTMQSATGDSFDSADTTSSVESADSAVSTDTVGSTDSVDSADLSDSIDSIDGVESSGSADSIESVESINSAESVDSADSF